MSLSEKVITAVTPDILSLEDFYTNLARNELSKIGNEYSDNEKEYAATMDVINTTQAIIVVEGATVKLSFRFGGNPDWLEVMDQGKGESYAGGDGGTVTNPDGSVEPSEAIEAAYGSPVPNTSEPPSYVIENIQKLAGLYFPDDIRSLFSSDVVATAAREELVQRASEILGGE